MNYGSAIESSPEPSGFGDIGTNIPVKLSKEELRELSTVNPILACIHIGAEWGLIVATIYICQRFWHPMLYVFAVAFIASRQHALLVLMHDGVHYRLLRNRRLNDWMSEVILAWPHFVSARQYRKNHFAHHRYLNTRAGSRLEAQERRPGVGISDGCSRAGETAFARRDGVERGRDAQAGGVGGVRGHGADGVSRRAIRILRGRPGRDHLRRCARGFRALLGNSYVHVGWCSSCAFAASPSITRSRDRTAHTR